MNNQSFRQLLEMPKYGKIRGAIRWYSRLPNLRKPIFASIYSRLLTWVNIVHRGSGGRYSRYFAGGFALRRCRNSIRRYSAAPKCEFRSQFLLLPLDKRKVVCFCNSALGLSVVTSCYRLYPDGSFKRKLISNLAVSRIIAA